MLKEINLRDHFLIAINSNIATAFHHAVVYVCEHNTAGSMGLMINQTSGLSLTDIFSSMQITTTKPANYSAPVLTGGPVKKNTGFVLHREHGQWESSLKTSKHLAVTASKDIIYALADYDGPQESIITLGFSGWDGGQLESEIANNLWLTCPADEEIIFHLPIAQRWHAAIESLGFSPNQLSADIGHA